MANKVDFPTFCHEPIILRGNNMGQSAHGSQYKIQPLFCGDWLKNRFERCYFTKTTTNGSKIEASRSCIFAAIILRGTCHTF